MAVQPDCPYSQFNFTVDFGEGLRAGFSEVSGLMAEFDLAEFRKGISRDFTPLKMPGLARCPNVLLQRGCTGGPALQQWIDQVRSGSADARRTVTIRLMSEDRSGVAMTWRLRHAWPVKWTGPSLQAAGNDGAMESLELAHEGLEVE